MTGQHAHMQAKMTATAQVVLSMHTVPKNIRRPEVVSPLPPLCLVLACWACLRCTLPKPKLARVQRQARAPQTQTQQTETLTT